jgi:hypothetical protein
MAVAVAVTLLPEQRSWPLAVRVSVVVQQTGGAVYLPVKFQTAPGAKIMGPMTGALLLGWLSTTKTLISVTFPALLTVPE